MKPFSVPRMKTSQCYERLAVLLPPLHKVVVTRIVDTMSFAVLAGFASLLRLLFLLQLLLRLPRRREQQEQEQEKQKEDWSCSLSAQQHGHPHPKPQAQTQCRNPKPLMPRDTGQILLHMGIARRRQRLGIRRRSQWEYFAKTSPLFFRTVAMVLPVEIWKRLFFISRAPKLFGSLDGLKLVGGSEIYPCTSLAAAQVTLSDAMRGVSNSVIA